MQAIIVSKGNTSMREAKALAFFKKYVSDLSLSANSDFFSIGLDESAKSISINEAKRIISFINLKPDYSGFRMVLVRDAQYLTIEAQNSLLKSIEELPDYALVAFSVDHHLSLIQTLRSRCRIYELKDDVSIDAKELKAYRDIFMSLLKSSIGKRIDWTVKNKDLIKDRNSACEILNVWELALRDLMVESSVSKSEDFRNVVSFAGQIRYLQYVKESIKSRYANPLLGIESFLVNLPNLL
ncbi:hypothetical protein A2982_02605 [candidate division WWE3 bacterium RIFCSPLOWO2_01_FULL_39_13]|uniref:DNA polymerase III subunit delta n=1 Tax=candidate division WWE3 bacterium RIFCSPLOWO2_01_FULL_39_13 TaxID=1802624 RepID=A0A1F4V2J1_UNCKA|nr:MAG: hypothetical protein A2982_02605 [candidate division WWE3 bacterium RIFCSPLOWO2_01_FULL_39_13]